MGLGSRLREMMLALRDQRVASHAAPHGSRAVALPAAELPAAAVPAAALPAAALPAADLPAAALPAAALPAADLPAAALPAAQLREFDQAVPRGLQVAAAWSWRAIAVVIVVWGIFWLARYLSEVMVPLAVAVLLAALLNPVTNRLRSWGLPRAAATAISVFGGLALIAGALTLIGTQIADQAGELSTSVVAGFNQVVAWLQNGPLHVSATWFKASEWGSRVSRFLADSQTTVATYAAEIGSGVGRFFAGFAIALFSLFYFLYDGRGIFRFLLNFVPRSSRDRVDEAALKGWRSLSSYVRATILVALVDGVGVLIVALIIGVPVAPALAALVFIGAFIPLVGALVSGFVAVIVALVALGWVQALFMLGGIILVMQIEGHVLQPFLLGRAVKLHPLAVLLAIATGIIAGGIVGALMAVPLLAFTKSFIQYLAGAAEPSPAKVRWPSPHRRS